MGWLDCDVRALPAGPPNSTQHRQLLNPKQAQDRGCPRSLTALAPPASHLALKLPTLARARTRRRCRGRPATQIYQRAKAGELPPGIAAIGTQSVSWLWFARRCRSQRPRCCNVAVVSLSPPPVAAACSWIQRHTSSRHPSYARKKNPTQLLWRISQGEKTSDVRILLLNHSDYVKKEQKENTPWGRTIWTS